MIAVHRIDRPDRHDRRGGQKQVKSVNWLWSLHGFGGKDCALSRESCYHLLELGAGQTKKWKELLNIEQRGECRGAEYREARR